MNKNSKYLIGSFTLLFAVILLANHVYSQAGVNTPTQSQSFKTYQNALFGFQFQYPSDFPQIKGEGARVEFPFEPCGDSIEITVYDLSEPTTLQKYLRAYLAKYPVNYDTLLLNQTTITPDKIPAIRAEFDIPIGINKLTIGKSILYMTMKNDTAYVIRYFFGNETIDKHLSGFQTIVDTFKIT